ncbi:DNA excision repair protein ERCC [Acrasis kona]|uniref:DNA excision repair protein ERCC n=1 Tax=Acrasis kona TaxID=1008807 RepID=A0AAW2ZI67_9EUKA
MNLLPFHNKIIDEFITEDGLMIISTGLGLEKIIASIIAPYCDPHQLVFVLNPEGSSENYLDELLIEKGVTQNLLPKKITNEFSHSDRSEIYLQGGVMFATSRILIVDMLQDRLPMHLISGIIVTHAERLTETCSEAFILRLYRLANQKGFVKAFSEEANDFVRGFAHVESVMKLLFVEKLFLWPRFHTFVGKDLDSRVVECIDVFAKMSPSQKGIENAIIDIIKETLNEIKRCSPGMDLSDFTVENSYHKSFDRIITNQLKPIWNTITRKTKTLIEDLRTMRKLLFYLQRYDCVTFYNFLQTLKLSEGQFGIPKSNWILTDQGDDIFELSKNRVYQLITRQIQTPPKKQKTLTQMATNRQSPNTETVEDLYMVLEENPKWQRLDEILDEINEEITTTNDKSVSGKVLVMCGDDKTTNQVQDYLRVGARSMLLNLVHRLIGAQVRRQNESLEKNTATKTSVRPQSAQYTRGRGSSSTTPKATRGRKRNSSGTTPSPGSKKDKEVRLLSAELNASKKYTQKLLAPLQAVQRLQTSQTSQTSQTPVTASEDNVISHFEIIPHPINNKQMQVIVSSLNDVTTLLDRQRPSFVVLFDHNLSLIRKLEVYKNSNPGSAFRVYLIIYDRESVEFKQYLSVLSREQESFKQLISIKSRLQIPSMESLLTLVKDVNMRLVGEQFVNLENTVVVDMREFRSSLPSLLNLSGMKVIPIQLRVGDYVVTRDLCVERKSTVDLWQSLTGGRLFTQCESMLRHYKHAALLIEFDARQAFTLMEVWEFQSEVSGSHIISKLALLTMHFPRLKIFWTRTASMTAKLFKELKNDAGTTAEPDPAAAQNFGTGEGDDDNDANMQAIEFLKRLPGVDESNVYKIISRVATLYDLSQLSLPQLTSIIGEASAKKLYTFLNESNNLG